jgi:hypothetical protein
VVDELGQLSLESGRVVLRAPGEELAEDLLGSSSEPALALEEPEDVPDLSVTCIPVAKVVAAPIVRPLQPLVLSHILRRLGGP